MIQKGLKGFPGMQTLRERFSRQLRPATSGLKRRLSCRNEKRLLKTRLKPVAKFLFGMHKLGFIMAPCCGTRVVVPLQDSACDCIKL